MTPSTEPVPAEWRPDPALPYEERYPMRLRGEAEAAESGDAAAGKEWRGRSTPSMKPSATAAASASGTAPWTSSGWTRRRRRHASQTHATFVRCSFLDSTCDAKGGAMYNDFDSSPTLVSCLIAGNLAHKGGGVANDGRWSPVITNCTFSRNQATAMYGALYSGTGPTNVPNAPVVTNCIFWSDTAGAGPGRSVTGTTAGRR
jgi:hypothetical protein